MPTSVPNASILSHRYIWKAGNALTRVGEHLLPSSINLGLENGVEVDIEAQGSALLSILQDRHLDVLLRRILLELAEVERGKPEIRVRTVVVVVPQLQHEVLRERVDE